MSAPIGFSTFSPTSSMPSPTAGKVSKRLDKQSVEDAFLKEAHKSPAQRLRDSILKQMGLTEDQLAAMDPKTRAAVEQKIAEEIKRQLQATGNKEPGQITDKLA